MAVGYVITHALSAQEDPPPPQRLIGVRIVPSVVRPEPSGELKITAFTEGHRLHQCKVVVFRYVADANHMVVWSYMRPGGRLPVSKEPSIVPVELTLPSLPDGKYFYQNESRSFECQRPDGSVDPNVYIAIAEGAFFEVRRN
jgi:hypothetical protein